MYYAGVSSLIEYVSYNGNIARIALSIIDLKLRSSEGYTATIAAPAATAAAIPPSRGSAAASAVRRLAQRLADRWREAPSGQGGYGISLEDGPAGDIVAQESRPAQHQ